MSRRKFAQFNDYKGECNSAPPCRHHHKCKQGDGWTLEQPEPGVLVWRTPARRTHTTTPTVYPL